MLYVKKEEKFFPYQITYKNNKHTYYRVKPGYIEVTTNKHYSRTLVTNFLDLHFDKFYNALNTQIVERDDEIILWDRKYELRIMEGNFKYEIDDDTVYVRTRSDASSTKKRIYHDQIINQLDEMLPLIEPVLNKQKINLIPTKYKYLKSKFGSYNRKHHEITLNTVLAKLDPIFLEYVLYHEYAHTKVFDHSRRFYSLLDELMPGHKTIQKRLKSVVIM